MRESTVTDKPQCRKDNAANNDCDANEFQRLGKLINEGMDLVGQIPIPLHIQVVVALMLAFRLLRDAGAIWPDNSCMSLACHTGSKVPVFQMQPSACGSRMKPLPGRRPQSIAAVLARNGYANDRQIRRRRRELLGSRVFRKPRGGVAAARLVADHHFLPDVGIGER